MSIPKLTGKFIVFLLLLIAFKEVVAQDSLRAKAIDEAISTHPKRYDGRRDITGDTVTFYMYHPKTKEFFGVIEYWNYRKDKLAYNYRYSNGELKRVTVYKENGVLRKDQYVSYYFEGNVLIHKETHGLAIEEAMFVLDRGNLFLNKSADRFKQPKYN